MVLIGVTSYFGMIVMAAIMGQAVYQDFLYQTHTLFFTSPISKFTYLAGRFIGSFAVLAIVFSSIGLGAWIGTLMPFVEQSMFGPNRFLAYLQPYLVIVLPNMLFIGVVFFSLAALTRRILPVYAASVVLLIGYLIAGTLTSEVEDKFMAALVDPFGLNALSYVTRYWTVAERNEWLVPFEGALLGNRLLWLALSGMVLVWASWRFRFEHGGERLRSARRDDDPSLTPLVLSVPPTKNRDFRALRSLPGSIWLNLKETVKNVYFLVIVLAGVLFMVLASRQSGRSTARRPIRSRPPSWRSWAAVSHSVRPDHHHVLRRRTRVARTRRQHSATLRRSTNSELAATRSRKPSHWDWSRCCSWS